MMKSTHNLLLCVTAAILSAVAAPVYARASLLSAEDQLITFRTTGIDTYQDGTTILDGECYVLVWSKAGKEFAGFNVNGTPCDAADRVVLVAPVARSGRCPRMTFDVPSETARALEGGTYSVCLVDTRVTNEAGVTELAGCDAQGRLTTVNAWGVARAAVARASLASCSTLSVSTSAVTSVLAGAPESVPQPVVRGLEIVNGKVRLDLGTLTNGLASVRVQYCSDLSKGFTTLGADTAPGTASDGGATVVRAAPSAKCGFFRVIALK